MSWSTWPVDENTLRATGPHAWMLALMEESQARRERRPYAFDGLEKQTRCPSCVFEQIGTMCGRCDGDFWVAVYFGAPCDECGNGASAIACTDCMGVGCDPCAMRGYVGEFTGGVVVALYSPENRDGRALCAACIAGGK